MKLVTEHFRFSWKITTVCLCLAAVMIWCSTWQWRRYKEKSALVATYQSDSLTPPLPFPIKAKGPEDFQPLINRRVKLSGTYDFSRQLIVTNKKHSTGPGHHLMTPLRIDGTDRWILIRRGFVPFEDREPTSWSKYSFAEHEELSGVLKASIGAKRFGPKNPQAGGELPFQSMWFYEEIAAMAKQLPYDVITDVYLQRVGPPPSGEFPAEAISIEVPPSTHFGYTIEWLLLAAATLVIGYVLQAFPWLLQRRWRKEWVPAEEPPAP